MFTKGSQSLGISEIESVLDNFSEIGTFSLSVKFGQNFCQKFSILTYACHGMFVFVIFVHIMFVHDDVDLECCAAIETVSSCQYPLVSDNGAPALLRDSFIDIVLIRF